MTDFYELGSSLFGRKRAETNSVLSDGTTHTYVGTATTDSADGAVMVELSEDVTNPEPVTIGDETFYEDADTSVELPTTASVKAGDDVLVTVYGGTPLRSPVVTGVVGSGDRIAQVADNAETLAGEAWEVAEAVGQHVWTDDDGLHITEITQEEWETDPSGANQLMNSNGTLIRDGEVNRTASTPSGYAIYDGQGNDPENIAAHFSADLQRIGKSNEAHVLTDFHSMQMIDAEGDCFFEVIDNRNRDGSVEVTFVGTGFTDYVMPFPASSVESVKVDGVEVSDWSYQLPRLRFYNPIPDVGAAIVVLAIPRPEDAGAFKSFTFGTRTGERPGPLSFASGRLTEATGMYSSAFGDGVAAWGDSSHAEGIGSRALGNASHAQNRGTIAHGPDQTAMGRFNVEDTNDDYALIIGNGTSDSARSNALTVDWNGNIAAGTYNGVNVAALDSDVTDLGGDVSQLSTDVSGLAARIQALENKQPVQLFKGTYSETYNKTITLSESVDNFSRICIEWRTSDGANGSTMLDMDVATVADASSGLTGRVAAAVAINNNAGATSAYIKSKLFFVSGTTIRNWSRTISSSTVYQRSEATVKNNAATTVTNNELIGITKVLGWR